jgi:hypothetical protein
MPAALMIGHHFSVSALWKARSLSGVCSSRGTTWSPTFASRFCVAGSARASMIATFSLPMMSFGVPFGAQIALQTDVWNPGNPASSAVGTSGAAAERLLPVNA